MLRRVRKLRECWCSSAISESTPGLESIARLMKAFLFISHPPLSNHPVFSAISPASLMVLKFSRVRQHGSKRDEEWRDEREREQLGQRDRITPPPCFSLLKGARRVLQHIWPSTLTCAYSKRGPCCQVVSRQVLPGPTPWYSTLSVGKKRPRLRRRTERRRGGMVGILPVLWRESLRKTDATNLGFFLVTGVHERPLNNS